MSKEIGYDKAYEELSKIIAEIENEDISIDDLSERVRRASDLIRICKNKLTSTEKDVDKILKDINDISPEE